jgi:adenosine deaminase
MLGVFPSYAEHPLPALLDAGVPCSLNADDPLLFGPDLLGEYELVRREFAFDDHRIAEMARASLRFGGASDEVADAGLAGIAAWLDSEVVRAPRAG